MVIVKEMSSNYSKIFEVNIFNKIKIIWVLGKNIYLVSSLKCKIKR